MLEEVGNIWDHAGKAIIVITTNGSLTRKGHAVLGNGVTRQAAAKYPLLAEILGALIREQGSHVFYLGDGLVSFPVEDTAWSQPDLRLISRSAEELKLLADAIGWVRVIVPRPGCGGGGLTWSYVEPLLVPWFDDRFTVISQE